MPILSIVMAALVAAIQYPLHEECAVRWFGWS
jgi:hypothetical protein